MIFITCLGWSCGKLAADIEMWLGSWFGVVSISYSCVSLTESTSSGSLISSFWSMNSFWMKYYMRTEFRWQALFCVLHSCWCSTMCGSILRIRVLSSETLRRDCCESRLSQMVWESSFFMGHETSLWGLISSSSKCMLETMSLSRREFILFWIISVSSWTLWVILAGLINFDGTKGDVGSRFGVCFTGFGLKNWGFLLSALSWN